MRIYIPENVDLSMCGPTVQRYPEDAMYFLHLLYRERIYNKKGKDGFIEIKKAYLRKQINGRNEKKLVDELVGAGIVERDGGGSGHFIKGEKSIGYRLADAYRNARHHIRVLTDKALTRRLSKWHSLEMRRRPLTLGVHQRLRSFLDLIEIDAVAAAQSSLRRYESRLAQLRGIDSSKATQTRRKASETYRYDLLRIEAFKNRDLFFGFDDYGRVHSNITNMSSRLRCNLHVGEKKLVEIDVVNSQPLIFGMFLIIWFSGKNTRRTDIVNQNTSTHPHPTVHYDAPFLHQHLVELRNTSFVDAYNLAECLQLPDDVVNYIRLCETGSLYEEIMRATGVTDRQQVKKSFFTLMFDRNRRAPNYFRRLFPSVYDVAWECKKKDYRHLSHRLQNLESKVIIEGVAARLADLNVVVATVHDSLLVAHDDLPVAVAVITEEFRRWSVSPALSVKYSPAA